ncbi:MAG: M48 family metalloprotease [Myxococcales bacterium]
MRIVYPLLALLAFLLFVGSTLAAASVLVVFPFLILALGALLLAAQQYYGALKVMGAIPEAFATCFRATAILLGVVFNPLLEREQGLDDDGNGPTDLPQLFALVDSVAKSMRTRSVNRIFLTEAPNACVFERGGFLFLVGTRRYLVIGVPLLYSLSEDELRAVLAHEFGHFAHLHTAFSRMVGRFLRSLLSLHAGIESKLSPLYWSTAFSVLVMESIYLPWMRSEEFEADRDSGRVVGSNHAVAALRKLRDDLPSIEIALATMLGPHAKKLAPVHVGEAAKLLTTRMSAKLRRELAVQAEGDVLDLEERTHPPVAQRIAVLASLPPRESKGRATAIEALPDVRRLERDLTRRLFRTGPSYQEASEYVPALLRLLAQPEEAARPPEDGAALDLLGNTFGAEYDPVASLRAAVEAKDMAGVLGAYESLPPGTLVPPELQVKAGIAAVVLGKYPVALAAFRAAASQAQDSPQIAGEALVLAARVYGEKLGDAGSAQKLYAYVVRRYPASRAATFATEKLRSTAAPAPLASPGHREG